MGSTRDLLSSSLVDSLLPFLRRSLEDVIYEILDQRQVPTRTDAEQLRSSLASLRQELSALRTELKDCQRRLEGLEKSGTDQTA